MASAHLIWLALDYGSACLVSCLTILFGTGVDYAGTSMRKLGQLHAVFLAQQGLVVAALADIVDLDRLVALSGHAELARVVEVDGEDIRRFAILGIVALEQLLISQSVLCQVPMSGASILPWLGGSSR